MKGSLCMGVNCKREVHCEPEMGPDQRESTRLGLEASRAIGGEQKLFFPFPSHLEVLAVSYSIRFSFQHTTHKPQVPLIQR